MSWLFKDPVVIMKEIMPWLCKDPINSDLAQFDHAQSTSKKWPKGWKDQIAPNEFFSQKTTNKIFMYLLVPFILPNFRKKILTGDPELFSGPKWPICPNQNLFGTNHYYFHLLTGLFHCAKSKKNSHSGSIVMRMHHFWTQKSPFAPNKSFFGKLLISFSSTY